MSPNSSTFRFVLLAGRMLPLALLSGCFLHGDIPPQPVPPTSAAHDSADKRSSRPPNPASPDNAETTASGNAKPVTARGLLVRGGWYRIPYAADEQGTGSREQGARSREHGAENLAKASTVLPAYHYRHAGLEQLLARPADQRTDLPQLLADGDRSVATAAAIAMARQGDGHSAPRLIAAIEDEELPWPARCAAAEALGQLPGDNQTASLQRLADRYGQFMPGASTGYQADLHAELLRALARHIDAGDDPRFIAAAEVPFMQVRIEALRAWAAGTRGVMPSQIVDLRSDDDPRVPRRP